MVVIETIGQQRLLSQSQRVDWCSLKMLWCDVTASQKIIKVQHHNHWCVRQAANRMNMNWPYRLINLWLLFPKYTQNCTILCWVMDSEAMSLYCQIMGIMGSNSCGQLKTVSLTQRSRMKPHCETVITAYLWILLMLPA